MKLKSERELASAAMALGAREVRGWSSEERNLVARLKKPSRGETERLRKAIRRGRDPLGEAFSRLRTAELRRELGATYTPPRIIQAMLSWASKQGKPARVVDPGVGSARFLLRAGRRFQHASLVGVEVDPLASLIARANLAVSGLASRAEILLSDYRAVQLPEIDGRTLYLGNPPYVRHHLIDRKWKDWLAIRAGRRGYRHSQLAGLHLHFFLATVLQAKENDFGAFITAAEWLDVNYGKLLRDLVLGELGGRRVVVIEPTAQPFPDAATTAAITAFEIKSKPTSIYFKRVDQLERLGTLSGGRRIRRERLKAENRWSHFTRNAKPVPEGYIELGELFRVHRGQVTGANDIWIANGKTGELPSSVLFPSVTKARELFEAGLVLEDDSQLRNVIDLPVDLSVFDSAERRVVDRFLDRVRLQGVHTGYVARNRRAWWSVGLREPAPILATYMARRPPAFVRNLAGARHINIAHGLYPRESLTEIVLATMASYLSEAVDTNRGRTYAGGLTKFEPREMERIPIPHPEVLVAQHTGCA